MFGNLKVKKKNECEHFWVLGQLHIISIILSLSSDDHLMIIWWSDDDRSAILFKWWSFEKAILEVLLLI